MLASDSFFLQRKGGAALAIIRHSRKIRASSTNGIEASILESNTISL
jgi:hypothetical protein